MSSVSWAVLVLTVWTTISCADVDLAFNISKPADLPIRRFFGTVNHSGGYSLHFSDPSRGWVVGPNGIIVVTRDGGTSWSPQFSHTGADLAAVCFSDSARGWAVGANGTIIATTDGGSTWRPQVSATDLDLAFVYCIDAAHGWIVGEQGLILATIDGGVTWSHQISDIGERILGIHFVSKDQGWAVGGAGTILATFDGGTTWRPQDSGIYENLTAVHFSSATHGWAVGGHGVILATVDGESTWTPQASHTGALLSAVCFLDDLQGWAVGGTILATTDGGATWIHESASDTYFHLGSVTCLSSNHGWAVSHIGGILSTTERRATLTVRRLLLPRGLRSIHFPSDTHGWAVGGAMILATSDRGISWVDQGWPSAKVAEVRNSRQSLDSVHFTSTTHGWIVGQAGIILNTTNGGASWELQSSKTSEALRGVRFVDDLHGWVVGERGTILATDNGGDTWERQISDVEVALNSAYFLNVSHGWIGGVTGTILTTADGGAHWNLQDSHTKVQLQSVYFTDLSRGWAVGARSTLLETSDGGATWIHRELPIRPSLLVSVRFSNSTDGVIAGPNIVLRSADGGVNWVGIKYEQVDFGDLFPTIGWRSTNYDIAPFVVSFLAKADHSQLSWTVEEDKEPKRVRCALEFRVGDSGQWKMIGENLAPTSVQGRHATFELSWAPSSDEYRVQPGKALHYRVVLSDARHEGVIQDIDKSYRYQSFFERFARRWTALEESSLGKTVRSGIILILLGGFYVGFFALLLVVRPAWLLWLTRLPMKTMARETGPTHWAGIVLDLLITLTLGRYFARHKRTRQAWVQSFNQKQATLAELDPEIRGYFLDQADVLDAWVEQHVVQVREAFFGQDTVLGRQIHVAMPVQLSDTTLAQLTAGDLRDTFARRGCLLIWGDGGTGKTSLACQVARWAMAEDPRERLAPHRMLPVLFEPGFGFAAGGGEDPFREAIRGLLTDAACLESPISPELLDRLLRHRRVLVILDSLSEMDDATRRAIEPSRPEFAAHALVVTSRRREDLRVQRTDLKPLVVKGTRLLSFFEAYFARGGKQHLFNDQEVFGACQQVAEIVGTRATTILFARLFADQMISARDAGRELEFPDTLPDLILRYLNNLIDKVQQDPRKIRDLHAAAKKVAWECLKTTFHPSPSRVEHILEALGGEEEARGSLSVLEHRVGIIKTVQPAEDQVRFALDPLAEFLAGLHLVETLADEEDAWRTFMASVEKAGSGPATIREFLLALRGCCEAKGAEHGVPVWVAEVLDEILSPEPDVS